VQGFFQSSTSWQKRAHIVGEKPFVCKTCGQGYSRPFVSATCNKNFFESSSCLTTHSSLENMSEVDLCVSINKAAGQNKRSYLCSYALVWSFWSIWSATHLNLAQHWRI
jgi:hypothetical protein